MTAMNLTDDYDSTFFAAHLPWREEYDLIAGCLSERLQFQSVLDLGCGNGFLLAQLAELGKDVTGVDGSANAAAWAPSTIAARIQIGDLTQPLWLGRRDLVICSEVAEHLDAAYADRLVENICINTGRHVFFTAATPGQGGHHHVNEQPHDYWIAKFQQRHFTLDAIATRQLRADLSGCINMLWWFTNNAMIFLAG